MPTNPLLLLLFLAFVGIIGSVVLPPRYQGLVTLLLVLGAGVGMVVLTLTYWRMCDET